MAGIAYVTDALSVCYGSGSCLSMSYGVYQFWPTVATLPYIILEENSRTVPQGSSTGSVRVDASSTAWTVTSDSSWLTVTKLSSTSFRYSYSNAPYDTRRTAVVTVALGSDAVSQFVLVQDATYHISISGATSRSVSSAAGETVVIVESVHGSSPMPATCTINDGWMQLKSVVHEGGGFYAYTFTYSENYVAYTRSCTIIFTQDELGAQATVGYNQAAKYIPASISGFTTRVTYGEWHLGTYTASRTDVGDYHNIPVNVAAIVRSTPIDRLYEADYGFAYNAGAPAPSTTASTSGTRRIDSGATINIPSGDTCYGIQITGGLNLYITNVSAFTVTEYEPYAILTMLELYDSNAHSIEASVSANTTWTAESNRSWLTVSKVSNTQLNVNIEANTSNSRTAIITLTDEFGNTYRTSIHQNRTIIT